MPTISETFHDRFHGETSDRVRALMSALDISRWTQIQEDYHGQIYGEGEAFEVDGETYAVLTADEADAAWETSLDSYLEECVYPDLPEPLSFYFDDEAWKRDARTDGRAHSISHYDGEEIEEEVNGVYYSIIRVD